MPTELRYEEHDHVGVITLDRPEARNALTHTTYAELEDAVRTTTARCLVITGADPAFCSGDDVKQVMVGRRRRAGQRPAPRARAHAGRRGAPLHRRARSSRPSTAPRWAGAWSWRSWPTSGSPPSGPSSASCSCTAGLCSDVPGIGRLAQLVGRERAAELLFTGRVVDAAEAQAHRAGVTRRAPRGAAADGARAGRRAIAANPPLAVQRLKQGLRLALDPDWHELGAWVSAEPRRAVPDGRPPRGRGRLPREAPGPLRGPLSRPPLLDGALDIEGHEVRRRPGGRLAVHGPDPLVDVRRRAPAPRPRWMPRRWRPARPRRPCAARGWAGGRTRPRAGACCGPTRARRGGGPRPRWACRGPGGRRSPRAPSPRGSADRSTSPS